MQHVFNNIKIVILPPHLCIIILVLFLGVMTYPTSVINSTPLYCTICSEEAQNCRFMINNADYEDYHLTNVTEKDPKYNAWWVKSYCTMTAVDAFILYFPYILIGIPLAMVLIEKGFIRYAAMKHLTVFGFALHLPFDYIICLRSIFLLLFTFSDYSNLA